MKKILLKLQQSIKESNLETILQGSFLLYVNQIITSLFGYLFWYLISIYLPIEDVGVISNFINFITFIGFFSRFGMDYVILTEIKEADNSEKSQMLINNINLIFYISNFCIISIYFIILNSFEIFQLNDPISLIIFIIGSIFWAFITLQRYYFIKFHLQIFLIIRTFIISGLRVLLLWIMKPSNFRIVSLIWVGTAIIGFIFARTVLYSKIGLTFSIKNRNIDILKSLLKSSFFNFLFDLIKSIPVYLFPIFITIIYGIGVNGIYYRIEQFTLVINTFIMSITNIYLSELRNSSKKIELKKLILLILFIDLIMIFFFFIFGKIILQIFNISNNSAYWLQNLLVVSKIPLSIYVLLEFRLRYLKERKKLLLTSLIYSFSIIISFIFLSLIKSSLLMIGLSWIIGYFIALLSIYLVEKKGKTL